MFPRALGTLQLVGGVEKVAEPILGVYGIILVVGEVQRVVKSVGCMVVVVAFGEAVTLVLRHSIANDMDAHTSQMQQW